MLKVVHINKVLIKKDADVATLAQTLRLKWEAQARRRAEKKYAAYENASGVPDKKN